MKRKELICIVCPNGCQIQAEIEEGELTIKYILNTIETMSPLPARRKYKQLEPNHD